MRVQKSVSEGSCIFNGCEEKGISVGAACTTIPSTITSAGATQPLLHLSTLRKVLGQEDYV